MEIPSYLWIKFTELCYADYQRSKELKRVRNIAENLDPNGIGTITVCYRNGCYYVVDGQHRIAALELLGYEGVTCQIIYNLSYEDEAALYNVLNNHKSQTPLSKFNAKLEAEIPDAVNLNILVNKLNLTIADKNGCGGIKCISTLERWYNFNPDVLERALIILCLSWPGNMHALNTQMIEGTCLFVKNHGQKIVTLKLIERLKTYVGGPTTFLVAAKGHPAFHTVPTQVEETLRGLYNYKLKAQQRI